MSQSIVGIFSSVDQLKEELKGIKSITDSTIFFTQDPEQYRELKMKTELDGKLMEKGNLHNESGIHGLATAFDEDDGSIDLMHLEESLRKEGFNEEDAARCKTFLHKGMIVVTEKV